MSTRRTTLASLSAGLCIALGLGGLGGIAGCDRDNAPPVQQRVDLNAQATPPRGPTLDPAGTADPNGFSSHVAWRKFDVAMQEAKASQKPIMMVVHTSWCGRCKALKPSFARPEVAELAKEFVMVNVDQDKVPAAAAHAPDGTYIPRVMFFSPEGQLDASITNGRQSKFDYFYTPQDDLTRTMKTALERHGQAG